MFLGELSYKEDNSDKVSFVGRPYYILTAPFAYQKDVVKNGYVVQCKKGMKTDFASIPKMFFMLNPKDSRWKKAAVIHDRACKLAREGEITMKQADAYLYYAMIDCSASKLISFWFWFWVSMKHKLE